jgi:hypothetical protein
MVNIDMSLAGLLFLAWIGITVGALVAIWRRILPAGGSRAMKAVLALGVFGGWILLECLSLYFALASGYCENCSDRPVDARYLLVTFVLMAPTLVVLVLFLWLRRKGS